MGWWLARRWPITRLGCGEISTSTSSHCHTGTTTTPAVTPLNMPLFSSLAPAATSAFSLQARKLLFYIILKLLYLRLGNESLRLSLFLSKMKSSMTWEEQSAGCRQPFCHFITPLWKINSTIMYQARFLPFLPLLLGSCWWLVRWVSGLYGLEAS